MATYYSNGQSSVRSTSQVIWQQGILVPQFETNTVSSFNGNVISGLVISLPTVEYYGFSSVCSDGNNGAYLLQTGGDLVALSSGMVVASYSLPFNTTYSSIALLSGSPYILSGSSGQLYTLSGSTVVATNVTLSTPCSFLVSNGSNLYSLQPSSSELVEVSFSTSVSGTTTTITTPMTIPSCVAVSGTTVGVGGYSYTSVASGFTKIEAYVSNSATDYILGIVSGTVAVMSNVSGEWAVSASLDLGGSLSNVALIPDGTQALITDTTNGYLYVIDVTNTSLTQAQKLTLAGAGDISILPSASQAIIVQSSQNLVSSYINNANVWSFNTSFSLTNPTVVYAYDNDSIVVKDSSGLSWYQYGGSTWNLLNSYDMTYPVTDIIQDSLGNFYVTTTATSPAGSSYGSGGYGNALSAGTNQGSLYVFSPAYALLSSISWSGSANAVRIEQGQVAILDSSAGYIRVATLLSDSTLVLVTSTPLAGVQAITQAERSFIVAKESEVLFYEWGPPYTLIQRRDGYCGLYSGSTWTTVLLGQYVVPTALAFDSSGNLWVATNTNTLFEISSSGTILSQTTISSAPNQPSNVPIGISSLGWWNGHLYGTSSLSSNFIKVI